MRIAMRLAAVLVLLGLAGCGSVQATGSSSPLTAQEQCNRNGGKWSGSACESGMSSGGGGY
jgi:hypothetical protein